MKKQIDVTSLSSEGEGIGSDEGLKVFVDGALPKETVIAKMTTKKKNYAKGELLDVLVSSPERVNPPCPLFGQCGGCSVMHLKYDAQLKFKQKRVEDALKRIGHLGDCEVLPCEPSPSDLYYRNKIQLPMIWENGRNVLGLYRKASHEIIPLEKCLIQCSQSEEIIRLVQKKLKSSSCRYLLIKNAIHTKEALVILVTNGKETALLKKFAGELISDYPIVKGVVENINTRTDNVILGKNYKTLAGRPFIYEKILNKTFKISSQAFFQVNPKQAEKLYERVISLAKIQPEDRVLDAFCGVGTLSLFAADHAQQVIGIEFVADAIQDAIENAQLNLAKNVQFICGKSEELLSDFPSDIVFLNPPRKGCDKRLIHTLLMQKPKKILYISCDPATLARDLYLLFPFYKPDIIHPFDMFPQTMHVETVVRLLLIS